MSTISLSIVYHRPLLGMLKILILLRLLTSLELGLFLPLLIPKFAESVGCSWDFVIAVATAETRFPCS